MLTGIKLATIGTVRHTPAGCHHLKPLMLLAVSFQRQPSLSFDPVLNQLAQLLDGAASDLPFRKGHQLAMPPEKGLPKDCPPCQSADSMVQHASKS